MKNQRLTIIAHLPHFKDGNGFWAYEPYVREINLWSQLFSQVEIFTEVVKTEPTFPLLKLPNNCKVIKVGLKSGPGLLTNLIRMIQLPLVFIKLVWIIKRAEMLHFRSPGLTTLIGNYINLYFNKPAIVKWATNFNSVPDLISNLELQLLHKPQSRTKVLIYGESGNSNHVSFFPALVSDRELNSLLDDILNRPFSSPIKIICVGRLFFYKEFDKAILALGKVFEANRQIEWQLTFVGDGEELNKLRELSKGIGVADRIDFVGKKSFNETCKMLAQSDISIVPGKYEGWCKVINESWNFGVIPMVTDGGNTSYPLRIGGGGGVIFKDDLSDFVDKFCQLIESEISDLRRLREIGVQTNRELTLEKFKLKLENVIENM